MSHDDKEIYICQYKTLQGNNLRVRSDPAHIDIIAQDDQVKDESSLQNSIGNRRKTHHSTTLHNPFLSLCQTAPQMFLVFFCEA